MNYSNKNEHIAKFLDYYVNQPDPRYAVLITGSWGCGKTHFIKRWKTELEENIKNKKLKLTNPIYISLFGLTSIQEVNDAITREVYPILKSKIYKKGKQVLGAISKVSLNCDLPSMIDPVGNSNPNELNLELDLVSLFKNDSDKVRKNRTIIFDDFERCKIDSTDMLGYINQFVEHSNIRVIIVCHEDEITNKTSYDRFKEKLIGRSFQIEPDTMAAIEDFCKRPGINQIAIGKKQQRILKEVFDAIGYNNLRPLYQALQDLSNITIKLQFVSNNKDPRQIKQLEKLLIQYAVAYCEYSSGGTLRDIAKNLSSDDMFWLFSYNYQNDERIKFLQQKYTSLAQYISFDDLFDSMMCNILNSISRGVDITQSVENVLLPRKDIDNELSRLTNYHKLENNEYKSLYKEVLNYCKDRNSDLSSIFRAVLVLMTIEHNGLNPLEDETLNRINDNWNYILTNNNDISQLKISMENVSAWVITKRYVTKANRQSFVNGLIEKMQNRIDELDIRCGKTLLDIDDNNYEDTINKIFKEKDSVYETDYSNKPLFQHIQPESIVAALIRINNYNKGLFAGLLYKRYSSSLPDDIIMNYVDEMPNLKEIGDQLKVEAGKKEMIDRISIERLSKQFLRAVETINEKRAHANKDLQQSSNP